MKITTHTKKDGSTVYRASVYLGIDQITGKKVKTTVSGLSKKEVTQKARRKVIDFEKNGSTVHQAATITTYQELVSLWLDSYRLTVKPQTFAVTQSKIKHHLLPVFGAMRLSQIRPNTVQVFVNNIAPKLVNLKEVLPSIDEFYSTGSSYNLSPIIQPVTLSCPNNKRQARKQ